MAANSLSLKALLNPDIYTWHTSLTNPNLFQRQALGIETKWARRSSGSWPMYLSGRLSAKGKSIPQFEQASIVAWLRLRFQNPEIAARPVVEKDGSAVVKCQVPRNEAQAIEWATKTLTVERVTIWTETVNGAEEILRQRPEISDDLILVRIHSRIKGNVLEAEYAFSVDHRVTDGVGSHIIAGKYFRLLAEALGESQAEKIEWEHCAENLSPPWISIVNDQQQTEGTEFAEDVKKLGGRVTGGMSSEWGLDYSGAGQYTPKYIHRPFSLEESTAILRAIKEKLGPGYTITHLGHAATTLMLLKSKPPHARPDSNTLTSPLFMNGRRYLDPRQPKSTDYIPMCRAFNAISFRCVNKYILSTNSSTQETHDKLRLACAEARNSYSSLITQSSLLTQSTAIGASSLFANTASADPAPNEPQQKDMADAIFLSDGIVERYVQRDYGDGEVLKVEDVRFTANPDGPAVLVRMNSFRDAVGLSAEWDGGCYADGDVETFLEGVRALVWAVTELDG